MQPAQIKLVEDSWKKVMPIKTAAAEMFYAKLFELDPSLRTMFKGNMVEQGDKLMQMIAAAVKGLNRLDELVPVVQVLGIKHAGYGVKDKHYDTVGTALIDTLAKGLGAEFTGEVKAAWVAVYGILAETMKKAANELVLH